MRETTALYLRPLMILVRSHKYLCVHQDILQAVHTLYCSSRQDKAVRATRLISRGKFTHQVLPHYVLPPHTHTLYCSSRQDKEARATRLISRGGVAPRLLTISTMRSPCRERERGGRRLRVSSSRQGPPALLSPISHPSAPLSPHLFSHNLACTVRSASPTAVPHSPGLMAPQSALRPRSGTACAARAHPLASRVSSWCPARRGCPGRSQSHPRPACMV